MRDKKVISILCPTRQRPLLAGRFAKSIMDTASDLDRVELWFYVDNDDPCLEEYKQMILSTPFPLVIGKPVRVGKAWNILADKCTGDYLMMGNDDLVSKTPRWDNIFCNEVKVYDDEIFCAWFNDDVNSSSHCAFPIVSRRWVDTVGYFMPEYFRFFYHDNWLEDLGRRVERLHYIPSATFEHRHFSTGKMKRDVTTIRNRKSNESKADGDTFERQAHVRNMDAGKLLQQMNAYKFNYTKDTRLEDILTGKRIALIGPAGYLEGKGMGEHFNNYDVICRINEVFPFGQEVDYGNRTDIIFHACSNRTMGNFRSGLKKNDFITSQILFAILPQTSCSDAPENRAQNFKDMNVGYNFNLYAHIPGKPFWGDVAKLMGCSPNTGFLAILILMQYDIKELLISGFSFYQDSKKLSHSSAYQKYGGEDDKSLPMDLHNQKPQIDCLKNFVLKKGRNKVVVDSYMNTTLGLNSKRVLNLDGLAHNLEAFQCREDLVSYLEGKRIALVGPAPYLAGRGLGKIIDGYDIVCRVNEVFPFGLESDYGSRTDIIFHCCGRPSMANFRKSLQKDLKITHGIKCVICPQVQSQRYRPGIVKYDTVKNFESINEFDIPFYQVDKSYWTKMCSQVGVKTTANTGLLSTIMLRENFDLKDLFITGFNFYEGGLQASQRHHSAYIEYGGDGNNKTTMKEDDGQSDVAYQKKQKEYFISTLWSDTIRLDTHLAKIVGREKESDVPVPSITYAVYRVLYGEDFIQESIKSILPFVDKVFVFWTNIPFGDIREVVYKGEKIIFPAKFDGVLGKVKKLQDKSKGKIELIYDHWGVPDNQVTHFVNERILPYYPRPDTVIFMEHDLVWKEEQLKKALMQFNSNGTEIAGSRQVELWRSTKYRIPERKRYGAIFYNMNHLKELPVTGKNGSVKWILKLDAEVHNCGFCVSENAMYWKHLTGIAFAKTIKDSIPNENWYEDKWLNWDFKRNNENLEISKGYESDIPAAIPYDVKMLPEALK